MYEFGPHIRGPSASPQKAFGLLPPKPFPIGDERWRATLCRNNWRIQCFKFLWIALRSYYINSSSKRLLTKERVLQAITVFHIKRKARPNIIKGKISLRSLVVHRLINQDPRKLKEATTSDQFKNKIRKWWVVVAKLSCCNFRVWCFELFDIFASLLPRVMATQSSDSMIELIFCSFLFIWWNFDWTLLQDLLLQR